MTASDQMRAAWSRRTDDELLRACFVDELSPDGRRVVTELAVALVGPLDAYVERFRVEQGAVVAAVEVRGCTIDPAVKDCDLPAMWGLVVLTDKGVGFTPGGHDDGDLGDLGHRIGGLAGFVGGSIVSELRRTSHSVDDLLHTELPAPLLARIDANAIWLPHGHYDQVMWGPDFGEVMRRGERLFSAEPIADVEATVAGWAAAQRVSFTAVETAQLLR